MAYLPLRKACLGSGLDFKTKGRCSLLERAMRGEKLKVAVARRDRPARFGFDVTGFVIGPSGGEIAVLSAVSLSCGAEELKADLCAVCSLWHQRAASVSRCRASAGLLEQMVREAAVRLPQSGAAH
jgi:putative resolvase